MSETHANKPAADKPRDGNGARRDEAGTSGQAGDERQPGSGRGDANERLDEALEETFPSSDPVSVKITK